VGQVGGDAGYHDGFGAAAEGVLEYAGEFGVSEGDEGRPAVFGEDVDALAEGEQTLVDVDALDEALGLVLAGLLVAREVDHEQLGLLQEGLAARLPRVLLVVELQDGVRARGDQVALGGVDGPLLQPLLDHRPGLGLAAHHDLRQVVDEDSPVGVLEHAQRLRALTQQVPDVLVVYLVERHPY